MGIYEKPMRSFIVNVLANIRNKTKMSILITIIQHCIGACSHYNQSRKRNIGNPV